METASKKQVGFIYKLLSDLGIKEMKADLAYQYSNSRTDHLSKLFKPEVEALINFLKKEANLPESALERMQRKILSMAHEMGWELAGGRINMERVNNWCIKYGQGHKPLDQYKASEMPQLVSQFETVYKSFITSI